MGSVARRIDVVDGLRGTAILLVLIHHLAVFGPLAGDQTPAPAPLDRFLRLFASNGHWGVHLFFIISGFCLYLPIVSKGHTVGEVNWKLFYARRAVRIWPSYLIALVVAIFVAIYFDKIALTFTDVIGNVLLLNHLVPGIQKVNGSFWTLSLELQFYALLPLLVWLASRYGEKLTFVASLLISIAYSAAIWYGSGASDANIDRIVGYAVPARLPEFVLGMLFAAAFSRGAFDNPPARRTLLLWAALPVAMVFAYYSRRPGHYYPFTGIGGLSVVAIGFMLTLGSPLAHRLIGWKPLGYVGLVSYSIYLMHQPMVVPLYQWFLRNTHSIYASTFLTLVMVCLACVAFYYAIEQPALALRKYADAYGKGRRVAAVPEAQV